MDRDRDSEHPRAVWAPNIAQELRSRDRYHIDYDGDTEWLIWARVPEEAILSTISIDSLREYIASHPDLESLLHFQRIQKAKTWYGYAPFLKAKAAKIDFSAGQSVGGFLAFSGIPEKYMNSTALSIAKAWKLRKMNDLKKKQDYLNGVYDGYSSHNDPESSVTELGDITSDDEEGYDDDFARRRSRIEAILSGYGGGLEHGRGVEPSTEEEDYDTDW